MWLYGENCGFRYKLGAKTRGPYIYRGRELAGFSLPFFVYRQRPPDFFLLLPTELHSSTDVNILLKMTLHRKFMIIQWLFFANVKTVLLEEFVLWFIVVGLVRCILCAYSPVSEFLFGGGWIIQDKDSIGKLKSDHIIKVLYIAMKTIEKMWWLINSQTS